MQIFWLKGLKGLNDGDPIDTYDIINKTSNVPTNAETPSDKNNTKGEKTIIKLYADLYKDANTGYYTYINNIESGNKNNPYAFVQTGVSDKVTITDEEKINGYKVAAWYTSGTKYDPNNKNNNDMLKASNMIATINLNSKRIDGQVTLQSLGGNQLRITQYQAAYINKRGYNIKGQKYFGSLNSPHGSENNRNGQATKGAKQYTDYKRLDVSGKSNYGKYNYKKNPKGTYVELGNDNTLVVLYTREMNYTSTGDYTSSSTITSTKDKRKDQSGNLTIVKLYGTINPNNYKIVDEKQVVINNTTRNVNINSETGYNLAEWIYVTGGAPKALKASQMGNPNLSNFLCDVSADLAYRLDGFVDGFKNNQSYSQYFKFKTAKGLKMPTINVCNAYQNVNTSVTAGRYSYGLHSGIGSRTYNPTIYLGGNGKLADNTPDKDDKNDVLYILFLKTDELSYSIDDLVIPESYLTRYDDYKHNPMTVTGSKSGTEYTEFLQAHKFKYVLPVVVNRVYDDVNPLFIPHIALTSKSQPGLMKNSNATSVHRLELDSTSGKHNVIKGYASSEKTGISDYIQLVYINKGKLITSDKSSPVKINNMLSVSALNLSYTAYRTGDQVKLANWKYSGLDDAIKNYDKGKLLVTDTNKVVKDIIQAAASSNGIYNQLKNNLIVSGSTSRPDNDSTKTFSLNFKFSEVGDGVKTANLVSSNFKATSIGQGSVSIRGVSQPKHISVGNKTLTLFNKMGFSELNDRYIMSYAECYNLSAQNKNMYAIHSLNRLYRIYDKDTSSKTTRRYATGITKYLHSSDVSVNQKVQYNVHYGSSIPNSYKDDTKTGSVTNGGAQSGFVKSLKASKTISFYPYYTMQYETPTAYNSALNKDGTLRLNSKGKAESPNYSEQMYIVGEEVRQLNVYDYAEVSYFGHAVSGTKGVDVVNNIVNKNRNGRIEINSEQWSTHARANSLIGLDNCALPGGATLSITIPTDNRQSVTITSYSAFLPQESSGYAQVKWASENGVSNAFGDMPTNTQDALKQHKLLVESVAAGFEGLNVEQYFSKNDSSNVYSNTKDHGGTYDENNTVYKQIADDLGSGKNLYDISNSKAVTDFTGKEDKYYFRPDGDATFDAKGKAKEISLSKYTLAMGNGKDGDGNTGDFDTDYEDKLDKCNVTYYTFYMNRIGQVLCIESSDLSLTAKANFTGRAATDGSVVVANWSADKGYEYASGLAEDIVSVAKNTGIEK